jgi:hypothetical protein
MTGSAAARSDDPYLPFLTAYDPSDLPGTSVDPLGFDRGYNFLADQILPGLTNVARLPRYFGLLYTGALLGPESRSPTRAEVEARQQAVLRLERARERPGRSARESHSACAASVMRRHSAAR